MVGLTFMKNRMIKLFLRKIHKSFRVRATHAETVWGYVFRVFSLLARFEAFYTQSVNIVFRHQNRQLFGCEI